MSLLLRIEGCVRWYFTVLKDVRNLDPLWRTKDVVMQFFLGHKETPCRPSSLGDRGMLKHRSSMEDSNATGPLSLEDRRKQQYCSSLEDSRTPQCHSSFDDRRSP